VTAAVVLPVLTLAVTEVAGVTHFLRWPQPTPDPNPPAGTPRQRSQQTSKGESTPQAAAPFTDADVMRITALPPAAQVEEVKQELKRCKPDFDGTLIPNLEAHEGAEARPPSRRYRLEKSVSALPGTYSAARLRPPHPRAQRNPANLLRTHRRMALSSR